MFQQRKVNEGQLVKDLSVRDDDTNEDVPVLSQESQRAIRELILEERSKADFDYDNRIRRIVLDGKECVVDVVSGTVRYNV